MKPLRQNAPSLLLRLKMHPLSRVIALSAFFAVASHATAQNLYRCGNTFSQTPCGQDAKAVRTAPSTASAPSVIKGKELCESAAPQSLGLKDPESTRFRTVRGKAEVIQYAGQPVVAVKYAMGVNTRNQYGAYTGEVTYHCFLSEDEQRLLQIVAAP